jgi:hypothetical protein
VFCSVVVVNGGARPPTPWVLWDEQVSGRDCARRDE